MPNGLKISDSAGKTILDSTTITYTLLGTLYCPANQTTTKQFTVGALTPFSVVYLTDTFSITTAPVLATASTTVSNGVASCTLSGGTVGCTAYVFAK